MPYKFTETRRNKIPKARYRVTNWPEYEAGLVRRGSLTVWLTEEAVEAWHAPATGERGGQPVYSAIAIETGLALRLVFHQPLRQTAGMPRAIADYKYHTASGGPSRRPRPPRPAISLPARRQSPASDAPLSRPVFAPPPCAAQPPTGPNV